MCFTEHALASEVKKLTARRLLHGEPLNQKEHKP